MESGQHDWRVRLAAFDFLKERVGIHGDLLPFQVLSRGFDYEGVRVPLLGPQGIFKPRVLPSIPLTITTAPVVQGKVRPYEDEFGEGGTMRYRYRGTDPRHRDNVGLRRAMELRVPLIYLYGIVKGVYIATWPAFVVGDEPNRLTFTVQLDESSVLALPRDAVFDDDAAARRKYITVAAKKRLHQAAFRERVLHAYHRSCAICRLRHDELLDAAHIVPDSDPEGAPVVSNGLALCKLHHAAFDRHFLGITPELRIEVAAKLLEEEDGPMLRHGLQGFHGKLLHVPRRASARPGLAYLQKRYALFRETA